MSIQTYIKNFEINVGYCSLDNNIWILTFCLTCASMKTWNKYKK